MASGKGRHGRERARGSFLGCREGGERQSRVRFGPRWRMEWETEVPVHVRCTKYDVSSVIVV